MPELHPRPRECLALLMQGLTQKQIAERLGISHSTVRSHLNKAYRALGVSNGNQAVAKLLSPAQVLQRQEQATRQKLDRLSGKVFAVKLTVWAFENLVTQPANPHAAVAFHAAADALYELHGIPPRERSPQHVALDKLLSDIFDS